MIKQIKIDADVLKLSQRSIFDDLGGKDTVERCSRGVW